jgi:hypothetical protein
MTARDRVRPALRPGTVQLRLLQGDPLQRYYVYTPRRLRTGSGSFVVVHGISRNAREQAAALRDVADELEAPLVAPLFDETRGRGYQQLSGRHVIERADRVLDRIVDEVAADLGRVAGLLWLWGYSGGAQFAHRYALQSPHRVGALSLGAAGWYTFPEADTRWPAGLRTTRAESALQPDLDGLLRIPIQVLVGSRDVLCDESLRSSPALIRSQGLHRLERARRWVRAINAAAAERGLAAPSVLQVLPGVGHDFDGAVDAGLATLLAGWLLPLSQAGASPRTSLRSRSTAIPPCVLSPTQHLRSIHVA